MDDEIKKSAEKFADRKMATYRTTCCSVASIRLGRAHSVCSKCRKDVTMELVFLFEMFFNDYLKKHGDSSNPKT